MGRLPGPRSPFTRVYQRGWEAWGPASTTIRTPPDVSAGQTATGSHDDWPEARQNRRARKMNQTPYGTEEALAKEGTNMQAGRRS